MANTLSPRRVGKIGSSMVADGPTEPTVSRLYRNVFADTHLLAQALRRGEMPEPLAIYPEQVPRLLREVADRLEGKSP